MKARVFGCISCSIVAIGSLLACSTSSSGSNSNGAAACPAYVTALIAYESRCGLLIVDPARANDVDNRETQLCQNEASLPGAPDLTSAFNACIAALANAPCNGFNQITACNFAVSGSLDDGATCSKGLECQSGACSLSTSDAGSLNCGTCVPAIADGASCAGGTCVQGDSCVSTSSGNQTTETCQKKPIPADVGAACTSSAGCTAPNYCFTIEKNGTATGTCTAPATAGAACIVNGTCASGLVCTGTPKVCGTPIAQGGACTGEDCASGLACDLTSKKCTQITFALPGATCDGRLILCSTGSCATNGGTSGTCPTIIADGQPCSWSGGQAPIGMACDDFATCTNGKCTLLPAACN